jgi:hypothetical protein
MTEIITEQKEVAEEDTTVIQHGFHQDLDGLNCPKRLWGSILTGTGLAMLITTYALSLLNPEVTYNSSISLSVYVISFGLGFFGMTIPEKFARRQD